MCWPRVFASIRTSQSAYHACDYAVEPDASAASYFFAAAAITGGRVTVDGLARDVLQGDIAFCECLARMGCAVEYHADSITVEGRPLRGIDIDMNAISDTVQTLGAVAVFAEGRSRASSFGMKCSARMGLRTRDCQNGDWEPTYKRVFRNASPGGGVCYREVRGE